MKICIPRISKYKGGGAIEEERHRLDVLGAGSTKKTMNEQ